MASRYPPVTLFDRVAKASQLASVYAAQALTNPRLRQELGQIHLVPQVDRVSGPGSTPLMSAFCHLNPQGSRFSDGSWGVYYAANSLPAAVAEVSHHRSLFLAATAQPAIELDQRAYVAQVARPLHDLRGKAWGHCHDPNAYALPQTLARQLRDAGSYGLSYKSVRLTGAECVAILRPPAIELPVEQHAHVTLQWNGQVISGWYQKSNFVVAT